MEGLHSNFSQIIKCRYQKVLQGALPVPPTLDHSWLFGPSFDSLRTQELLSRCQRPRQAHPVRVHRVRFGGAGCFPPGPRPRQRPRQRPPSPGTALAPSAATWQRRGCNPGCSTSSGSPQTSGKLCRLRRTFSVFTEKSTVTYSSQSHKDLTRAKMSFMYISQAFF